MMERGVVTTKGEMNNYIDNYFPVSVPATKSAPKEDVIYAVNFTDGGYALLAADSRIPEDILAVTDDGRITESDFEEPVFEKVVTDNDDLSESEYDAMVESGVLATIDIENQINRECLQYAVNSIDEDPTSGDRGGSATGSSAEPETYSWEIIEEVPRMLSTAWTQDTEDNNLFNKYCPVVGLFIKRKAPAGCVCIALSQIIAYHEYPDNLTCNGIQIEYPAIKRIYYYNGKRLCYDATDASIEMLAQFCITIGGWCNTKYHSIFGKSWGFAWPTDAKSCLETFGYKNVSLDWKYDEARVLECLDNGCPVFMS
ncbi:MAG: C10 family peptidase, partial [Bacteroidales bacterium]|nr:C10 family peptidase [Bacteroidales bacterium]